MITTPSIPIDQRKTTIERICNENNMQVRWHSNPRNFDLLLFRMMPIALRRLLAAADIHVREEWDEKPDGKHSFLRFTYTITDDPATDL
jgi:hypothetical protein